MKYLKRNLERLNNLLQLNCEVEEVYQHASNMVDDNELRAMFKMYSIQRHEFSNELKFQIEKLGSTPLLKEGLSRINNRILMKIGSLIEGGDLNDILHEINKVEQMSISSYNIFLQERNVPLSVCKLLIEQRDSFQRNINTIKVKEALVA